MKTVSIGYYRDSDGDFAILATLNNKDEDMADKAFKMLVDALVYGFHKCPSENIIALEREDATDYVNLEIGD